MKILLFSSLYPSAARPVHGVFVETRLRELLKTGQVQAKVVAPVPWFPFQSKRFGEYAQFAQTPQYEVRNDIEVHHPRYWLLPKVGMNIAPDTMARAALPVIRRLIEQGFDFDLIDAHYYYPDGVAAMHVAKVLGKPFVVTARGTDLNLIPDYPKPRARILEAAAAAKASIGVCQALMTTLEELGADPKKLHTLRNGVDLERFKPEPRTDARQRLGLDLSADYLLSVGHLIERKGHHIAIDALVHLPHVHLLIVGAGPERERLQMRAKSLNVMDRVSFVGQIPNQELKWWYSAANALTLCSDREGWANVLLEAMACDTPVLATNIWGTPEVVNSPDAGRLLEARTGEALAAAWQQLVEKPPRVGATREHAEKFSWEATTQGQLTLFRQALMTTEGM